MKTKDLKGFEPQLRQLKEILRSSIERLEEEIETIADKDEIYYDVEI